MRLPRLTALPPLFAGPLALCWAMAAAASVRPIMKLGETLGDTDDAMRLVQVRALLGGRPWYDLVEPRLNPPEGLHSHWSRLVDAPIAALMALGRALFGEAGGEIFVRIAWPLMLFGAMTFFVVRAGEKLSDRTGIWIAAALAGSCGMIWLQYEPGRVDHHNVQILLMAAMMVAALDFKAARNAVLMGALAGVSIAIGFESLPVIVWAGALAAYHFVFEKDGARPAFLFGLAFAGATALCFLIQTPPGWWFRPTCDALGFNSVAGAMVAGLGLAAAARFTKGGLAPRIGAALAIGACAAYVFLAPHPACLRGPYGEIDPRLIPLWLNKVGEAQPLASWIMREPVMAISGALMPLATLVGAFIFIARGERRPGFLAITGLLALTSVIAVIQVRGFTLASAAAMPLAAAMLCRVKPIGAFRPMTMGLMLGLAASPLFAQILLNTLLPAPVRARTEKMVFNEQACFKNAAFAGMRTLPPGIVLADLDAGSHIIAHTQLSAVAAPYQRIDHAMLQSVLVFAVSPAQAAEIARDTHANYIALCKTGVFATIDAPNSLAVSLLAGRPPSWMTPLPSTKGDYLLYRVERNRLPAGDELRGREES